MAQAHDAPPMEVRMSSQDVSTGAIARNVAIRVAVGFAIVFALLVLWNSLGGGASRPNILASAHLHAPRWDLVEAAPLAIKIHLATVLAAVVLATIQIFGPKGTGFHRALGWTLAVLLTVTAVASLFIRNPAGGLLNPFQIFSVWTLIAVPLALVAARNHNVRRHAYSMTGLYFGGLILAGALTFLPGRLMWRIFFG
jgi:uncharacterized membrane protein